jgi:hypothetical protein
MLESSKFRATGERRFPNASPFPQLEADLKLPPVLQVEARLHVILRGREMRFIQTRLLTIISALFTAERFNHLLFVVLS